MLKKMIILCGILLSINASASPTSESSLSENYVIGLSAGPTWGTGNKTQTIRLQTDIDKTYTADKNKNTFTSVDLFIGRVVPLDIRLFEQFLVVQLGVALSAAGNAKLAGDVWEDADPDFNNYNYSYTINHRYMAIKARLVNASERFVAPYISASAGMGLNRSYDFKITPKISSEVAEPGFKNNSKTAFSYTLGLGLQKTFSTNLQAAIGYEFADWGKISLARSNCQTLGQGLSLKHLYAQQMQITLFYII